MLTLCHRVLARAQDKAQPEGRLFPRSRVAKMFVYPFGVSAEQAPTTIVPGSHRLPGDPHHPSRFPCPEHTRKAALLL